MSHNVWLGGAKKINQVSTYTVSSFANNETFSVLLHDPRGGASSSSVTICTYTASSGGTTDDATKVANAIYYLLTTGSTSGSSGNGTGTAPNWKHDLAQAITWTQSSGVITATANVAGVPFNMADSGTGTATVATTTANAGPNDWDCGSNWSLSTVPVDTDTILIQGNHSILYPTRATLPALADVYAEGNAAMGYAGIPLRLDTALITINSRAILHLEFITTTVGTMRIIQTGADAEGIGLHLYWQNAAVTNMYAEGGVTRMEGVNTANTITDINVEAGATVIHVMGIVTNAVVASGGNYISRAVGLTTAVLTNNGGEIETQGTLVVTTLTNNAGRTVSNSTGTITTLNANGGLVDFTQSKEARTVTTLTLAGGAVRASTSIVTFTNAPASVRPNEWREVAA